MLSENGGDVHPEEAQPGVRRAHVEGGCSSSKSSSKENKKQGRKRKLMVGKGEVHNSSNGDGSREQRQRESGAESGSRAHCSRERRTAAGLQSCQRGWLTRGRPSRCTCSSFRRSSHRAGTWTEAGRQAGRVSAHGSRCCWRGGCAGEVEWKLRSVRRILDNATSGSPRAKC